MSQTPIRRVRPLARRWSDCRLGGAACATTRAATPVERPALEVPPPPPRVITPLPAPGRRSSNRSRTCPGNADVRRARVRSATRQPASRSRSPRSRNRSSRRPLRRRRTPPRAAAAAARGSGQRRRLRPRSGTSSIAPAGMLKKSRPIGLAQRAAEEGLPGRQAVRDPGGRGPEERTTSFLPRNWPTRPSASPRSSRDASSRLRLSRSRRSSGPSIK